MQVARYLIGIFLLLVSLVLVFLSYLNYNADFTYLMLVNTETETGNISVPFLRTANKARDIITISNDGGKHVMSAYITNINSDCAGIAVRANLTGEGQWRPVSRDNGAFVFSAYFTIQPEQVVVIGIKEEDSDQFYCQMWHRTNIIYSFRLKEVKADVTVLPDSHDKKYAATLFSCLVKSHTPPLYVSIVTRQCMTPLNLLPVRVGTPTQTPSFTVCPAPVYNFTDAYKMIEWIELNKILGAEKITLYNVSTSGNMDRIFDHYSKRGIAEVVRWQVPVKVDTLSKLSQNEAEIHYFGQVAALYDCLYRCKINGKYIVNIDLDEFIIPRQENVSTWADMLKSIGNHAPGYLFRNALFSKHLKRTATNHTSNYIDVEMLRLLTLTRRERRKYIDLYGERSKYIAQCSKVSKLMIHNILEFSTTDGEGLKMVPVQVGMLHHYRDWKGEQNAAEDGVLDNTVPTKYGITLKQNVRTVWSLLNKTIS